MRIKIKLNLDKLPLNEVVTENAKILHKILGDNNKWHNMEQKPFTCSSLLGGKLKDKHIVFNDGGYLYINSEDDEVINAIIKNEGIVFSIENPKIYNGYNILSAKKIIFNTNKKKNWITEENKKTFIDYVKNKYCVDIEILKIRNSAVTYKNGS